MIRARLRSAATCAGLFRVLTAAASGVEDAVVAAISPQKPVLGSQGEGSNGAAGACRPSVDAPPVPSIADPEDKLGKALTEMKPETMLPTIDLLLTIVRQLEPSASQADIVNGLTLAYWRAEAQNTQVTSRGKD